MQLIILAQPRGDDFFQVKSHGAMFADLTRKRKRDAVRLPISIGLLSAHLRLVFPGECRSNCVASHWNHSKVFCEPLRPAFLFDVRPQFTPRQANRAADKVRHDPQGNDPRINRVTESPPE